MTRIAREELGAWLIKWNPVVWDLAGFVDAGGSRLTSCAVADNYRSRLMAPGDPLLFWVSGTDRRFARGLWGVGTVTGPVERHREPPDTRGQDHWLDEKARRAVHHRIAVDVRLRAEPLRDHDLRVAGIDDLEVQRMPAGSNPSWASREQVQRMVTRCDASWLPRSW